MRSREEKADRAAVYANVWEDERIFVEKTQSREIWPIKMLEEEGFAVQRVDG